MPVVHYLHRIINARRFKDTRQPQEAVTGCGLEYPLDRPENRDALAMMATELEEVTCPACKVVCKKENFWSIRERYDSSVESDDIEVDLSGIFSPFDDAGEG